MGPTSAFLLGLDRIRTDRSVEQRIHARRVMPKCQYTVREADPELRPLEEYRVEDEIGRYSLDPVQAWYRRLRLLYE